MSVYLGKNKLDACIQGVLSVNEVQPGINGNVTLTGADLGDEHGSNANGGYHKFANGLMICEKTVTWNNLAITSAWSSIYESTWLSLGDWPVAFVATPATFVQQDYDASSAVCLLEAIKDVSATSAGSIMFWRATSATVATNVYTVMGIGRWK